MTVVDQVKAHLEAAGPQALREIRDVVVPAKVEDPQDRAALVDWINIRLARFASAGRLRETEVDEERRFWEKLRVIIDAAIACLTEAEKTERVEWCNRTGSYGASVGEAGTDGSSVRVWWGGQHLIDIPRSAFYAINLDRLGGVVFPNAPGDAHGHAAG